MVITKYRDTPATRETRVKDVHCIISHAKNIFPSNNWFNNDCKKFKRSVADLAAKMKKDPENLVLRNLYWTKRKQHKILTKQAKQKAVDRLHKHFRKVNHQKF